MGKREDVIRKVADDPKNPLPYEHVEMLLESLQTAYELLKENRDEWGSPEMRMAVGPTKGGNMLWIGARETERGFSIGGEDWDWKPWPAHLMPPHRRNG